MAHGHRPTPGEPPDVPRGGDLPGAGSTAARLRAVLMKLGQRLRAIDAGTGFTPSELSVLGTVARHGPLRSSDLAHIEGVNPTMASRLLSHLVEEEALSRTVDPSDRRVTLVVATAYGRHLHDRLRAERARALDTLLRMLPDRQRSAISSALPGLEALADLLKDRPR